MESSDAGPTEAELYLLTARIRREMTTRLAAPRPRAGFEGSLTPRARRLLAGVLGYWYAGTWALRGVAAVFPHARAGMLVAMGYFAVGLLGSLAAAIMISRHLSRNRMNLRELWPAGLMYFYWLVGCVGFMFAQTFWPARRMTLFDLYAGVCYVIIGFIGTTAAGVFEAVIRNRLQAVRRQAVTRQWRAFMSETENERQSAR